MNPTVITITYILMFSKNIGNLLSHMEAFKSYAVSVKEQYSNPHSIPTKRLYSPSLLYSCIQKPYFSIIFLISSMSLSNNFCLPAKAVIKVGNYPYKRVSMQTKSLSKRLHFPTIRKPMALYDDNAAS